MKEFKVTEEILKFFEVKKVTNTNVIKAVPNYMDYAEEVTINERKYCVELNVASENFYKSIITDKKMTKREFINRIEDSLEQLEDNSKEYYFDGSGLEYGTFVISEAVKLNRLENNLEVLFRLSIIIKQAKDLKKSKLKLKLREELLLKIANDPDIMATLKRLENK